MQASLVRTGVVSTTGLPKQTHGVRSATQCHLPMRASSAPGVSRASSFSTRARRGSVRRRATAGDGDDVERLDTSYDFAGASRRTPQPVSLGVRQGSAGILGGEGPVCCSSMDDGPPVWLVCRDVQHYVPHWDRLSEVVGLPAPDIWGALPPVLPDGGLTTCDGVSDTTPYGTLQRPSCRARPTEPSHALSLASPTEPVGSCRGGGRMGDGR